MYPLGTSRSLATAQLKHLSSLPRKQPIGTDSLQPVFNISIWKSWSRLSDFEPSEGISRPRQAEILGFGRTGFQTRRSELAASARASTLRPLTKEDVRSIAEIEFGHVLRRVAESGLDVTLTGSFKDRAEIASHVAWAL